MRAGAATNLGWATSKDGGRTWRRGVLPSLTTASIPPGPSDRASDPVVAYSVRHGVWLISGLAIQNGVATRLTIHRSRDGISWSTPVDAALAQTPSWRFDKQWLTCDNGAASPYRGRCYLAYTDLRTRTEVLSLQRSDDGGLTWSAPVTFPIHFVGVIPVVLPNGRLVLSSWAPSRAGDRRDRLDRRRPDPERTGTDQRHADASAEPFRAPPLVAAELDAAGRRRRHLAGLPLQRRLLRRTTSSSSRRPTAPPGRPCGASRPGRHAVMPTIGVDPGTGRLAILYYVLSSTGADVELVTSADGTRWSAPQRLTARRMSFDWMPETTLGRMLADYIAVTWSRGRPVAIYAHASPPRNGKLRTAIYATDR